MSWFNPKPKEMFYIGARVERIFGFVPDVVYLDTSGKLVTRRDTHYTESVERFYQVERHSHQPRHMSMNLHISHITKALTNEFFGNCSISVWESDIDCYTRWHESIKDIECMEARFR